MTPCALLRLAEALLIVFILRWVRVSTITVLSTDRPVEIVNRMFSAMLYRNLTAAFNCGVLPLMPANCITAQFVDPTWTFRIGNRVYFWSSRHVTLLWLRVDNGRCTLTEAYSAGKKFSDQQLLPMIYREQLFDPNPGNCRIDVEYLRECAGRLLTSRLVKVR